MSDAIRFERERGLLTLRLNRPDKKNALTRAMYSHLAKRCNWRIPTLKSMPC